MNYLLLIASGLLGGSASIFLRLSATRGAPVLSDIDGIGLKLLALGAYGAGFILYAVALRKTNLASAYPLMVAVSMLLLLAFTAWHERALTGLQVGGAALILVGIWLVTK